jgi:hypothetical protein
MRLSARILENVTGVNTWSYAQQAEFTEGDAPTIYLQLDGPVAGQGRAGVRPRPGAGTSPHRGHAVGALDALDDSRKITRAATQPYAQDPSIWALQLLATDKMRGTVSLKLTLTETGPKITYGVLPLP